MKKALVILIILVVSACTTSEAMKKKASGEYDQMSRADLITLAKKGDLEAQYHYGMLYCCGIGDQYDNALAFAHVCQAAKDGYADAQFQLGNIYKDGIPFGHTGRNKTPFLVPVDLAKAHMWYAIAAQAGHDDAMEAKKKLAKEIDYKRMNESFRQRKYWKSTDCSRV